MATAAGRPPDDQLVVARHDVADGRPVLERHGAHRRIVRQAGLAYSRSWRETPSSSPVSTASSAIARTAGASGLEGSRAGRGGDLVAHRA